MSAAEYTPGSPEAIAHGCTCPSALSWHSGGVSSPREPVYECDPNCPMHGLAIVKRSLDEGEASIICSSPGDEDDLGPISRGAGVRELEVNAGKPWSDMDIADLRQSAALGSNDLSIAEFLCRPVGEIRAKAAQLRITIRSGIQ